MSDVPPPVDELAQRRAERIARSSVEVPSFVEIEPDRFKLVTECSSDELLAAANALSREAAALLADAEALTMLAADDGWTVVDDPAPQQ